MSEQLAVKDQSRPTPVVRQLHPQRFKVAEFERQIYVVTTESGMTEREILNPAFWAHVAAKLQPYDHIEVRAEDGEFWAELLVLSTERVAAHVELLRWVKLGKTVKLSKEEAAAYVPKWAGPHHKWQVVRASDNEVVKDGIASKPAANKWISNHVRALRH